MNKKDIYKKTPSSKIVQKICTFYNLQNESEPLTCRTLESIFFFGGVCTVEKSATGICSIEIYIPKNTSSNVKHGRQNMFSSSIEELDNNYFPDRVSSYKNSRESYTRSRNIVCEYMLYAYPKKSREGYYYNTSKNYNNEFSMYRPLQNSFDMFGYVWKIESNESAELFYFNNLIAKALYIVTSKQKQLYATLVEISLSNDNHTSCFLYMLKQLETSLGVNVLLLPLDGKDIKLDNIPAYGEDTLTQHNFTFYDNVYVKAPETVQSLHFLIY